MRNSLEKELDKTMIYNITYVTGWQKERMAKHLCGTNMTWLLLASISGLLQKDLFKGRESLIANFSNIIFIDTLVTQSLSCSFLCCPFA